MRKCTSHGSPGFEFLERETPRCTCKPNLTRPHSQEREKRFPLVLHKVAFQIRTRWRFCGFPFVRSRGSARSPRKAPCKIPENVPKGAADFPRQSKCALRCFSAETLPAPGGGHLWGAVLVPSPSTSAPGCCTRPLFSKCTLKVNQHFPRKKSIMRAVLRNNFCHTHPFTPWRVLCHLCVFQIAYLPAPSHLRRIPNSIHAKKGILSPAAGAVLPILLSVM